ncbi:MAG: hypothetical protein KBE28_05050 [Nitrospira sp.]|nr:hypothetical protein [Nitrospira sp.]
MTIKSLAHSAQKHLQATSSSPIKRAHVYELIAAAFGFGSYAALNATAIFADLPDPPSRDSIDPSSIQRRAIELGYDFSMAERISTELADFLASRDICAIRIHKLLDKLRDEWGARDLLTSPVLLESLEASANRNIADAHYALALIYGPDEYEDNKTGVSDYWYNQGQQGRVLTGVEIEWADAYTQHLANERKYVTHLREAARLGNQLALIDTADQFDDPTFFEQTTQEVDVDPSEVARIAQRMGRDNDARTWLTRAAECGNIEAMRELIEHYDSDNLLQCWTWIYLAQLRGTDLTRDDYHAINEDGSPYDDDVGGPLYADGTDGLELSPLPADRDQAARIAAKTLFSRIPD